MADKRSRTEVTIAVIGLVGVLGAALIANWDKLFRKTNPNLNTNGNLSTPLPKPTASNSAGCMTSFFEGVPPDRLQTLEAGAKDVQIIAPQQAKDQPIAVKLEEDRNVVG